MQQIGTPFDSKITAAAANLVFSGMSLWKCEKAVDNFYDNGLTLDVVLDSALCIGFGAIECLAAYNTVIGLHNADF